MRSVTAILCALLVSHGARADANPPQQEQPAAPPSSVTIPLTQYESLRTSSQNAAATVVDTMTISGTFAAKDLTVTLAGRSVGARAATDVISDAPDVTISGCSGDALLVRAGKGSYQLVALGPSFTLRCEARLAGSDRLRMTISPAVLAVRSAVSDGELVPGEEDDDGARGYTLVRQVVGPGETLATTATGRYLITLLPDTTRFRYVIQVHNPNRNTSPLPLRLVSGEHLQQIDSSAPYEPKDGSYVFAMPPGDSEITLTGELQGTGFAPPVEASLQYVVIESHPLLRPVIQGAAKRVSAGETGITTQYRGPLAFEIGARERITWNVTRLEAMRAISYAVRNASHTLFVPANGPVLGQSELALDNQGAPELVLPRKPEPTFVSLGGEPVLMTRNAAGELTVPLSAGEQQVVVQHRQPIAHLPLVIARLDVPRLSVPATYTNVSLRYPEHWLPLWQSFATQATTWRPDGGDVLAFLLLALWIERCLAWLAMKTRSRIAAAVLLAFAAMLVPIVLWAVVLGCGFVTVVWIATQRSKMTIARVIGAVAAAGLVCVLAIAFTLSRKTESDYSSAPPSRDEMARTANANAVTDTSEAEPKNVAEKGTPVYQGLPAKFELPGGVRFGSFSEQLLAPDRPHTVTLVILSMTFVTWLAAAMALAAAWLVFRERAAIRAAMRARMAEAVGEAPAPA